MDCVTKKIVSFWFDEKMWHLFQIWALGITLLMAGNFFLWNQGLQAGVGGFCILAIIAATVFVCLLLCISEILSGLPFSGGAYGMVRCSVGFFPGYIIGCSEICYYILQACLNFYALTSIITQVGNATSRWQQAGVCFCLHLAICLLMVQRKSLNKFWKLTIVLALSSLILIALYCFVSLGTLSSKVHGNAFPNDHSLLKTLRSFQSVTWFYTGIECLAFACNLVSTPRELIAKGFFASFFTIFVSNVFVICTTLYTFNDMDELIEAAFPLSKGFILVFKCTENQASLISIVGILASAYGCTFAYSKLLLSLAESALFPSFLAHCTTPGSPYNAILFGAQISYCVCLILVFDAAISTTVSDVCFLAAYTAYLGYGVSYIILKQSYTASIDFAFKSPFGIVGALYVIFVFSFGILSICVTNRTAFLCLLILWVCASLYYFKIANHQQKFSAEEQKTIFLTKGVINGLKYRLARKKRHRRIAITNNIHIRVPQRSLTDFRKDGDLILADGPSISKSSTYSLEKVHRCLIDPTKAEALQEKARELYCVESVDFCLSIVSYRQLVDDALKKGLLYNNLGSIHRAFVKIVDRFVREGSSDEVNLSAELKKSILKLQNIQVFSALHPLKIATILDESFSEIERVLAQNLILSNR